MDEAKTLLNSTFHRFVRVKPKGGGLDYDVQASYKLYIKYGPFFASLTGEKEISSYLEGDDFIMKEWYKQDY